MSCPPASRPFPRASRKAAALVACCLAASLTFTRAASLAAQARPALAPLPYTQTVSASPLTLPFGVFAADYETKVGAPGLAVGASGTYSTTTQLYPRRDRFITGRLLYYLGGRALEGLAVGVTVGAHRAERKFREDPAVLAHDGGATLGALGTYNTFFRPDRRLVLGTGLGVEHVLKSLAQNSPLSPTYFVGRIVLGVAF